MEGDAERERRGGEKHHRAGETGHIDIPSANEMNIKSREGIEMVVDVGEVENCSVDHVCVPSSIAMLELRNECLMSLS